MDWTEFEIGRVYNRVKDIHEKFGGQRQGGISTPSEHAAVFAFTGKGGSKHGYDDYETDDGVFCLYGEGQIGDMAFVRGNVAVRDHVINGKDLLLFEMLGKGKGVRFKGSYICDSWDYQPAPDSDGTMRRGIVFHLIPIGTQNSDFNDTEPNLIHLSTDEVSVLRSRAYIDGEKTPRSSEGNARRVYYERSKAIRDYALARAAGICEMCEQPAPFITKNGMPYLEVHHIQRLSDGGPDHPSKVGAICPNCHRAAHFGSEKKEFAQRLLEIVALVESQS